MVEPARVTESFKHHRLRALPKSAFMEQSLLALRKASLILQIHLLRFYLRQQWRWRQREKKAPNLLIECGRVEFVFLIVNSYSLLIHKNFGKVELSNGFSSKMVVMKRTETEAVRKQQMNRGFSGWVQNLMFLRTKLNLKTAIIVIFQNIVLWNDNNDW